MDLFYYVLTPFTWLLNFFYSIFDNYGFAIISFAIVVKIILFPFALKGKRSMIQMNMLSAKTKKLQKQCGNNRAKYNEEVQKLYIKENVNPLGGCLWSLLPMFVLLPLYAIIREPLKFMIGLDETQILQIASTLNWDTVAVVNGWATPEVIAKAIEKSTQAVAENSSAIISGFTNGGYNQLYLASLINESNLSAVQMAAGEGTQVFAMNFNFFGMNLASVPDWRLWDSFSMEKLGLFIMVLISAATGALFSLITMKTNRMNTGVQNDAAERTQKTMLYTMPIMSLWIGFAMPAGLCVYWIANNLLSMVQELIAGRILKKDYAAARIAAEEHDRQEKEEEKRLKIQAAEERSRRIEDEKNNRGKKKKLPAAKIIEEAAIDGVNREDSRVGMRTYARGRSYDPNRYGDATPQNTDMTMIGETTEMPALEEKSKEEGAE